MTSAQTDITITLPDSRRRFDVKKILGIISVDILIFALIFTVINASYRHTTTNTNLDNALAELTSNKDLSLVEQQSTPSPISTPEPVKNINPFNGLELSSEQLAGIKNRPLAVMIDNSTPGRKNQNNINRADMVYEAVTEYGITRFMPIFYSDQSDFRVMPVRSVRMHFLNNLLEYNDPLLYHVGGAYTPNEPRTNVVQKIFDKNIKSIYYYKHTFAPTYNELYEPKCTEDPSIPGYSCKYQTTATLWKKATEFGYQTEQWEPDKKFDWEWKFGETTIAPSQEQATSIVYRFAGHKEFEAEWKYDSEKDVYLRNTADKVHMDKELNEQIKTTTLIVQKVPHKLQVDEKGRAILTITGEGDAYVFEKGKAYEVKWKKDCDTCRTRYYEKTSGNEFTFQPGRIWVSITRDVEKVGVR